MGARDTWVTTLLDIERRDRERVMMETGLMATRCITSKDDSAITVKFSSNG